MSDNLFKKRILFVGMPDMACFCLDGLVRQGFNIVGAFGAKKNHPTYPILKNLVNHYGLNFLEYDSLSDDDFIAQVRALNADIAVVCSFNYKIPKVLLDSVKGGFINIHPSLLPDYRGPNPYSAVIFNEEKETGVTLHFMDETFDTGDVIFQKKLPIMQSETMGTLFNRLNMLSLDMLIEVLKENEKSNLRGVKQPTGDFKPANAFSEQELFVDYSKSAREIDNLVRALNPFILARTNFRGTLVKVLSSEYYEGSSDISNYGEIVEISDSKIYVSSGDGLFCPTSMQFGSFFVGTSKEFIKILNPKVGERFV